MKKGILLILILIVGLGKSYSQQNEISKDARMQWWKDARFGMFIHWGVYSVPAGEWKGKPINGFGEWIQHNAKIPSKEYHELTKQFNPVKFDAKTYVKLAKDAGMKYITITAKHHDGFAMFKSEVSNYNIVDATPFGRDPIKELAEECHKQGLKICFYYSQEQDWNEPGATGNKWDGYAQQEDKFQEYLDKKVKPQLTELLTNYGEIGVLWFDTPNRITFEQGTELKKLVRSLQPKCIISGRLGGGVETDYATPGDNSVPAGTIPGYWEVPATLNDTWGFKKQDNKWKSPKTVVPLLFDIASKGGNYLLNIGPTSEGVIPQPSVDIFREVGKWMAKNSEAIYATNASPYKAEFQWGGITTKEHKMYLGFSSWPKNGEFSLDGLITEVKSVYLLTDTTTKLTFKQTYIESIAQNRLFIDLPEKAIDPYVSVVVVELVDYPEVSDIPTQSADGTIIIPACKGIPVKNNKPVTLNLLGRGGSISGWTDDEISLNLEFKVEKPGTYKLDLITNETGWYIAITWQSGHIIDVLCNGQKQQVKITRDKEEYNPKSIYYKKIHTYGEPITFDKPGVYTVKIDPVQIKDDEVIKYFKGFTLSGVRLIKQ